MELPAPSCSPPSTPESNANHSAPVRSPTAFDNVPPETQIGSLDLKPCSVEEFLDIDASIFGKYEYVEGILVALPMANGSHDNLKKYLHNGATARYIKGRSKHPPASEEALAIPHSPPSPGKTETRRTIRRPDLSIAAPLSPSRRNQLSPKSQRISNPIPGLVDAAIEITSHNEKTDTVVKVPEYEKAEVNTYVVVNRDVNCKDESKRDERVEVLRRDSTKNSWGRKEVYRGNDDVDMGPFGVHKPQKLFSNPDPSEPLKELAREINEGKKQIQEAKKQAQILSDKLMVANAKKRKYKRVLKEKVPEEDLSSSSNSGRSSKTNSPDRKRKNA